MKIKRIGFWILAVNLMGCGGDGETDAGPRVDKADVAAADGKGDAAEIDKMCEELGREPGCDPCSIQGWYGDGTCDDFCPVHDTDCGIDAYALQVTLDDGLSATVELVYQATKDSFGCTDLTFDELTPKRVPEQIRKLADSDCQSNADDVPSCTFTFPNELGDGCLSVISFIHLYPRDAERTMEPWAALQFSHDGEHDVTVPEIVDCKVIVGGQDGATEVMMCGNDLLHYDGSGRGNVRLNLETDDPN